MPPSSSCSQCPFWLCRGTPGVPWRGTVVRGSLDGSGREKAATVGAEVLETGFQRLIPVVPLSGEEGVIPVFSQGLPPEGDRWGDFLSFVPNALLRPVDKLTRVEHGPAGDADRPGPRALVECMGEGDPVPHQPVQMGGTHRGMVQGMDRAVGLIVCEQKKDIGLGLGCCLRQPVPGQAGAGSRAKARLL